MLLVVNAGSSSIKAALYNAGEYETPVRLVSVENIGSSDGRLVPDGIFGASGTQAVEVVTHVDAMRHAERWFREQLGEIAVDAIGHRIVHGGSHYREAARVDERVIDTLSALSSLAPNHMPAAIACVRACQDVYSDVPQVVCFDTGFFADVPRVAQTLPIPRELSAEGVRRYGFHGLSYSYLLESFRAHEGEVAARGRVIMAHLGSGASLAALKNGTPVDMSMGFTPVSGIMMSTRTGDIEPGVFEYLAETKRLSTREISELVATRSGLSGVSGGTRDMHQLLQHQATDDDAALAVELFCYQIKKQIGAYAAVLGGLDSIIFTGGIGERSAEIRARVLSGLDFLGIVIEDKRNQDGQRLVSAPSSRVGVHVIPAREDYTIATQTERVLKRRAEHANE